MIARLRLCSINGQCLGQILSQTILVFLLMCSCQDFSEFDGLTEEGPQSPTDDSTWSLDVSQQPQDPVGAYVSPNLLWKPAVVPVCWVNPQPWNSVHRTWVHEAVVSTWAWHAKIDFVGWSVCGPDDWGVKIQIDDSRPWSHIGTIAKWANPSMSLNLSFDSWAPACKSSLMYCIRAIAVHEFGHAIGFTHEQERPDTPANASPWCTYEEGSVGYVPVGPWDLNSVMNYCNPEWNNGGALSPGDIAAVRQVYGPREESSFDRIPDVAKTRADVNGDGRADLVDVYFLNPGLRIHTLLSNGDGTWIPKGQDPWPGYAGNDVANWRPADIDGDGKMDLVDVYFLNPGLRIHTLRSKGDGTWTAAGQDPWPNFGVHDVTDWRVADITGDGRADLVNVHFTLQPTLRIHSLLSKGDGTWIPKGQDTYSGYSGADVDRWQVSDVNGDERMDLVSIDWTNPGLRVYTLLSNGDGTWSEQSHAAWSGYAADDASNWKVADVDGDGRMDLVDVYFLNPGLRIHTLLSNGDGTWAEKGHNAWPGYSTNDVTNWKVADLNGDGKADFVDVYDLKPGLRIQSLLSNGDGTWVKKWHDAWPGYAGGDVSNWKTGDVDGDDAMDLVDVYFLNPGLRIHALLSNGDGNWSRKWQDPWPGYLANDVKNWKVAW